MGLFIRSLIIWILIFVSFSCSKEAEFKIRNKTVYLYVVDSGITEIEEVIWRVGPRRKQVLSQGVRIRFTLPLMNKELLKYLYKNRKANSWLIRLKRRTLTSSKVLGYFSLPFAGPVPGNPHKIYYQSPKKAVLGVNYAASAISMRLSSLLCPALGHRKKITDLGVTPTTVRDRQLLTSTPADSDVIPAKVEQISYSPIVVNGGVAIKGDYYVDIALYQQSKKLKLSSWVTLENTGSVRMVEEVIVKGCKNIHFPGEESKGPTRKFKFGR